MVGGWSAKTRIRFTRGLASPRPALVSRWMVNVVLFRSGIFTTSWVKKLESGTDYYANVVDMALTGYVWDHLLDLEDDSDDDGNADDVLNF